MKAGIYYNKKYLSNNQSNLDKIKDSFKRNGAMCKIVETVEDLEGIDILMVLGGDGTILNIAAECAARSIKIIGVNYGHMGFLAEFEPDKLDNALQLLFSGTYKTEKRSMLKIEYENKVYYALNDLVIQRSTSGNAYSNTVNLSATIDGSVVDNYSVDGLIISTPTGSTAYSLAAGGSILTPEINAFIMTPICPHSLHSRPIVFSDTSTVSIYQIYCKGELNIIVDGKAVAAVTDFKDINVTKADRYVEFISSSENDFFNKLLIKLNIWSR
jgi:NAD+ kinase